MHTEPNGVVNPDRHAPLYYRGGEHGVMAVWHEFFLALQFALFQVGIGLLLGITSVESYYADEDFVPPKYGLGMLSPDCGEGCLGWQMVIWCLHLWVYVGEVIVAYSAKDKLGAVGTKFAAVTCIFFAVSFCVHPLPWGIVETKFVEKGFGDPFRCIAAILLFKWWATGAGDRIGSESWLGLMIVSHDRLFYGSIPLLVWALTALENQDWGMNRPTVFCASVVSVMRLLLYKHNTSCLLIAATPREALFLCSLLVLHGVWKAVTVGLAWCQQRGGTNNITVALHYGVRLPHANPFNYSNHRQQTV